MNKVVKEMVLQDIQGNNKNPKLSEVKQIVRICEEVHRKHGTGQADGRVRKDISRT